MPGKTEGVAPPLKVRTALPRLEVTTWLLGVAPPATARPATVWLNAVRSSVPLVEFDPKVTAPAAGSALLLLRTIVPPWIKVPPV